MRSKIGLLLPLISTAWLIGSLAACATPIMTIASSPIAMTTGPNEVPTATPAVINFGMLDVTPTPELIVIMGRACPSPVSAAWGGAGAGDRDFPLWGNGG